jgi:hypothetical protein
MKIITDENKIEDILRRGTEDIIEKESLKKRIAFRETIKY